MHPTNNSLKNVISFVDENQPMLSCLNTKYLSIFISPKKTIKTDTKITYQNPSPRNLSVDRKNGKNFPEISSATLPKNHHKLSGLNRKNTIGETNSFEKAFLQKYLQPFKKQDEKTPKFKKKPSLELQAKELKMETGTLKIEATNTITLFDSQTSIQEGSLDNITSSHHVIEKVNEFSLEDYKFIQEIIQSERKNLEQEILAASENNVSRISISKKHKKYWDKLRQTLTAVNRMQHFTNDIKKFGTSFALSALKFKFPDFDNKLILTKRALNVLFSPNDKLLVFWEILLFFSMIYTIFVTPIRCVFFDDELALYPSWIEFETFLNVFLTIDIAVTLNTAYIEDHKKVVNRWKIFRRYAKTWLIIDILSIYWFEDIYAYHPNNNEEPIAYLSMFLFGSHLHELLRIFRIRKISITRKIIEKIQDGLKMRYAYMKLLTFFLSTLICVHIVSCLWYFVAKIKRFGPDTWVREVDMDVNDYFSVYLKAFYWGTMTLSTVGYGDIHAGNELEYFFSIVWLILGAGFYSYTIGSISTVITNSETKRSLLFHKKIIMESFMDDHKFSTNLKHRIKKALEYQSQKSVFSHHAKQEILDEIPVDLKFEMATCLIGNMNTNIPFFSKKDKVFLANFIPLLTPLNFLIGEYVYKKNEYPSLFYILLKGRVNLISGKLVYKTIIEGSYFGEIEIFQNCTRICSLQAAEYLDLLMLTRQSFEQVMKTFPDIEAEMRETAIEKLRRIKQSEQKVKPFMAIPKNAPFWGSKSKNKYIQFKENKMQQLRRSVTPTPTLQRKGSINAFFSAVLRKKSLCASPTSKFSAALKKLSVFSGKKEEQFGFTYNDADAVSSQNSIGKKSIDRKSVDFKLSPTLSPLSKFKEMEGISANENKKKMFKLTPLSVDLKQNHENEKENKEDNNQKMHSLLKRMDFETNHQDNAKKESFERRKMKNFTFKTIGKTNKITPSNELENDKKLSPLIIPSNELENERKSSIPLSFQGSPINKINKGDQPSKTQRKTLNTFAKLRELEDGNANSPFLKNIEKKENNFNLKQENKQLNEDNSDFSKKIEIMEGNAKEGLGELRRNLLDLKENDSENLEKKSKIDNFLSFEKNKHVLETKNNQKNDEKPPINKILEIENKNFNHTAKIQNLAITTFGNIDKIIKKTKKNSNKTDNKNKEIGNLGDLVKKNKEMLIGFETKMVEMENLANEMKDMVFLLKRKKVQNKV